MLNAKDVLAWPYEDLPVMDASESYQSDKTKEFNLQGIRAPSSDRKLYNENKIMESLAGNYVSAYDRSKGHNTEVLLVRKLRAIGLECYELPHYSGNYLRHIDIEVQWPNGSCLWLDAESPKALKKGAPLKPGQTPNPLTLPQDRFVCLQLGSRSTLFGGSSDYLAFGLTNGEFLFSKKEDIVHIAEQKVHRQKRAAWPQCALWYPYVRTFNDVSVVMTYMDLNDLHITCKL